MASVSFSRCSSVASAIGGSAAGAGFFCGVEGGGVRAGVAVLAGGLAAGFPVFADFVSGAGAAMTGIATGAGGGVAVTGAGAGAGAGSGVVTAGAVSTDGDWGEVAAGSGVSVAAQAANCSSNNRPARQFTGMVDFMNGFCGLNL